MFSLVIVSLLSLVGSTGRDDADILAPCREGDMIEISSQGTEHMEPLFPIVPPCIFLYKPLRVGKAWDNIKEVDAVPLPIALSLRFIPFIPHGLLYVQIVCTVNLLLTLYMPSWCQPSSV
jgi:hypothetical protein